MSDWIGSVTGQISKRGESLQAQEEAKKQNEYNRELLRLTAEAANKAAMEDFVALRERAYQEREAAAQEIRQIMAESRQGIAGAKLQAIEGETGGRSVAALLADFERAELANVAVSADNLAATERQLNLEARAAVARRDDRIAAARRPFVEGPYDTSGGRAANFLPA